MYLYEVFENDKNLTLIDALGDFLPLAVEYLQLSALPKISFNNQTQYSEQASFGMYQPDEDCIYLVIANRQPVDILRTLAHELAHAKQREENRIEDNSGETGSPIENEANAAAGVIMRHFAKQYPQYLLLKPILLPESVVTEKKRKRKKTKSSRRPYSSYYGYYWGGVNNSTEHGSVGSDGGGESVNEAVVGTIKINDLLIRVDDHSVERTQGRRASPQLIDYVLKLLPKAKDKIDKIESGQQFWVYSPEVSTALGFRKQTNSLLFKTVILDKPHDGPNPVITVGK